MGEALRQAEGRINELSEANKGIHTTRQEITNLNNTISNLSAEKSHNQGIMKSMEAKLQVGGARCTKLLSQCEMGLIAVFTRATPMFDMKIYVRTSLNSNNFRTLVSRASPECFCFFVIFFLIHSFLVQSIAHCARVDTVFKLVKKNQKHCPVSKMLPNSRCAAKLVPSHPERIPVLIVCFFFSSPTVCGESKGRGREQMQVY